jgi:hypothetical protein
MVIKIDKTTGQRYSVNPLYNDDIVYDAISDSETIRNEDVVILGSITSFKQIPNAKWGTIADIEGEKIVDTTSRGNNVHTHVTRQRTIYQTHKKSLFTPIEL